MGLSLQDKLLKANDPLKRKLYHIKLKQSGHEHRLLRLRIEEDDFGDENSIVLKSKEAIIVEMTLPDKIPLSRLRQDLTLPGVDSNSSSFYLYDNLPIIMKASFEYKLYKDDLIIKQVFDETENRPFYLSLQVVEALGDISPNSLINLEYNVAPYIMPLPPDIAEEVYNYFDES